MRIYEVISAAALLSVVVLHGCAPAPGDRTESVDLFIDDVTVYSGLGGDAFVADVAVRDGVFAVINRAADLEIDAAQTVDGNGLYMTPGLWDMHTHVRVGEVRDPETGERIDDEGELDLSAFPSHGVTSIRDLGGVGERVREARLHIERGEIPGPTIYTTYETLNGQSFAPFQIAVTTPRETRDAVRAHAEDGADQIKIHRALEPELLPVVVQAAHEQGLTLTGHIPLGMSPLEACEAGMDGIEHIVAIIEAWLSVNPEASQSAALEHLTSDGADPFYECLASRGIVVDPTVVFFRAVAEARSDGEEIPPAFRAFIEGAQTIALRLYEADVILLTGTDTSDLTSFDMPPGSSLLDELSMLQEAGIPAADIIPMATINAARTLGVANSTGSVEVGKDADFLLLSADPGADIDNVRALVSVYRAGGEFSDDAAPG